jgi:chromosome segregation ATPase
VNQKPWNGAACEMSSEKDKNEVERREQKLKEITDKRDELSTIIESWDRTIDEAKVAYLGAAEKVKKKIMKEVKDLEAERKNDLSRLEKAEKKLAEAAVEFLNVFSD